MDFKGTRFIFLWTGKYDYRSPSKWDAKQPMGTWTRPSSSMSTA